MIEKKKRKNKGTLPLFDQQVTNYGYQKSALTACLVGPRKATTLLQANSAFVSGTTNPGPTTPGAW